MCGLVVTLNLQGQPADTVQLRRMTDVISHRGPDDDGFFVDGPLGLGFRRLAILDLTSSGHQPMSAADGLVTIAFNGEIFNYFELRRELSGLGHNFVSSGDTEVLLHAYLEWGIDCLARLNGMWAFVIYDKRTGTIFGSRDRFGIKPLYTCRTSGQYLIASEIKSIRSSNQYESHINWKIAAKFLLNDSLDESDDTFFSGIEAVSAGSAFQIDFAGHLRQWRYWDLPESEEVAPMDPASQYGELFDSALALHMRSDVPVGVHLSGGLDSTAILCGAANIWRRDNPEARLKAFSFYADGFDESEYINATLVQSHAHLEILRRDSGKLWNTIPRLLWYHDEPVHSMGAVVGFQLMDLTARAGIKVVLNGQGADETAGGYSSYFVNYWQSMLAKCQFRQTFQEITEFANGHGKNAESIFKDQLAFYGRSTLSNLPGYRRLSQLRALRNLRNNPWIKSELVDSLDLDMRRPDYRLRPILADAVKKSPLPLYLRVEDRNASAHSIESRVPFLDYRLVEFLFKLPDNMRIRGPWNKYTQREGLRGKIPESVRRRVDKMGFPTGDRRWFGRELYEPLRDLFSEQRTRARGIFRVDRILSELDRGREYSTTLDTSLFKLAQFELWSRQIEGRQSMDPNSVQAKST